MKAALSLSQGKRKSLTSLFFAMVLACVLMAPTDRVWGQTTVKMGADGAQHILPFNNYYHHSWNQMIYTAEEIGGAKTITAISFLLSAVPSTNFSADNLTVYMGHTTLGGATGENDLTTTSWVPSSSLTQVYTATNYKPTTLTTYSDNSSTNGWITITLNTSFSYNGTDNLAIVIAESNTTYTSGLTFKYITDAHNLCLYRRSDSGTGYDSHPGSASGTLLKNRPVMKLCAAATVGDVVNIKKTVVSGDITFVDEGGSGGDCSTNYASGNYYTLYATYRHIFTTTGATLRVTFSELCTESSSYDWMYVYDGYNNYSNALSGKLGGSYSTMPGPYSSTGQSLTFSFRTDSSNDRAGWNATINRVPFPTLTYSSNPANGGTATVIQNGSTVSSGTSIEPGTSLNISATANQGCTFTGWTVSGTGASVASSSSASTTLTMGTANTTLTANFIVPPANSTCATATTLPCGTSSLAGTTVGTPGDAHGIPGVSTSNYGVWYTFEGTGLSTTITTTSTIDDRIVVCKGSCGGFEVVVNRDGTTGSESVTFETESGATYYVYISHYSSSSSTTGTFTISRTCAPTVNSISAPAAVCAGNTLSLTAPTVTANGSTVTAQGWQYSSNNSSWNTFDPATAVPYSYNGYYLRYYATNAGGTTYSNTVQMTVNEQPVISSVTSNVSGNTLCNGSSVTLTASSSNATSYTWNNGAGSGASVTVTPSSSTTYTVTAAIGSCTTTGQIAIEVMKAPVITSTPASTECIAAGTQVTLKGGVTLEDYEFSTGTSSAQWYTLTNTTNIMDGGTSTGDYAYSTVKNIGFTFPFAGNTYTQFSVNSDGNLRLGSTVTGTGNYSSPFTSSNANVNNPKINGMGFDGYFDVSSYGNYVRMQVFGTEPNRVLVVEFYESPYNSTYRQYPWKWQVQLSENGTVQIVYGSSSPSSYGVANQIGLCVDASDGWTISTTAHTATHFTNGTSTSNASSSSWPGANRYYRFTPPPTPIYAWSYSGTSGTANGSNYTVAPTALFNTYTVSATYNGCTLTDNKTVTTVPTLSSVTSNATSNTICNGSSATLTATSNASSLSWNNGAGNGASVTVSPSATTTYTVTASANGCTNTGNITITVNNKPTLTTISAPAAVCAGNALSLTAPTVTANGSTVTAQGWQYSANGSSNWNTFSTSTPVPYSYNGYYLRYYATNGCGTTYSNTVQMTVNDQPVISSVTSNVTNNTICGEGNSATLTANSSNATSYSWSDGAGSGASVTVNPSAATTYTVTAAIGSCTTTGQIAIEVMKAPVITSTPASTECIAAGTQVTLKGGVTLEDYEFSTGTSSAQWYNLTNSTNLITSTGDGVASALQEIGFSFPFAGNIYTQFSVNSDGNLRLGATVTGTGNYSTPFSSSNANINNPKINGMGFDGTFNSSYSNHVYKQVFGTEPNRVLVVEFLESPYSSSYNQYTWKWQVQLSENGTVQIVYGSSAPGSYNYSNQIGLCADASDGWTISTTDHTATHFTNGTSTSNAAASSWPGANRYYRFTPPPTPIYAWSYSGTSGTANGSNYTVAPTALSNTYTVSATYNGCTLTDNKTVTTVPALSISSSVGNASACGGSEVELSATSNASNFTWSDGAGTTATVTVHPETSTIYYVTASSGSCTVEGSVGVTVINNPTVTITPDPAETCIDGTAQMTIKANDNITCTLADYVFSTGTSSSEWYILTNTTNIMDGGTTTGDYAFSTAHDIGFTFPFAGINYTQFSVNSDGNLRLGSTVTGTGNYSSPFSSSNASINNPKINGMGFDGYFDISNYSNHVYKQVFGTSPNRVLVVEFYESPYSSTYRQYPWKWQVQLSENGTVQIVYASSSPSSYGVANQIGLCVDASDGCTISTTAHTATHFTNGTSTTNAAANSWPGANRYYRFTPPTSPAFAWTYNGTQGSESTDVITNDIYTVTPAELRNSYSVTNPATGCSAQITLDLMDAANITAESVTIDCGNSTTLTASGLDGVTYNWYSDAACTQLVQANSASLTTPVLDVNTTYYLKALKGENCETQAKAVAVTVNQPIVPLNLQVSNIDLTTATVSWSANGASSWQYNYNGSWNTTSNTSVNLTGLTPGQTYTFQVKSVIGSCESSVASTTFTTLSTHTLSASVNPANSGTISDGNGNISGNVTYNHGTSVSLTATAATGYTFQNWTVDGSTVSGNPTSITMNADHIVTANFQLNSYAITATASPAAGGTVSGDGNYNHGDNCTVTATANTGYTFDGWYENNSLVSTSAAYSFTVTAARTLEARYTLNSYAITATANPAAGGTVSGDGTYNHGDNCTVIATANTGYTFDGWYENSSLASSNAAYSFTVTAARTLEARYTQNNYTLTINYRYSDNSQAASTYTDNQLHYGDSYSANSPAITGYTPDQATVSGNMPAS
ncbi:MAG: InlB B-repeat-containing protein, partial [Bacteroidales bacterium]|nr:InlB B-repeat-containing protein [Bacteroidales bacterium]